VRLGVAPRLNSIRFAVLPLLVSEINNSLTKTNYDIAIIGAGPSGSTCALALGKTKLRVALIDKASFPREKTCGDAVAAYVPKVLNTISPQLKDDFLAFSKKYEVDTIRLYGNDNNPLDLSFGESGYITKRVELDHFLFQKAQALPNVSALTNFKVSNISRTNDGFLITTGDNDIQAKLIIGCDGANGISRKYLDPIQKDKLHYAGAVRAYYKNVTGIPNKTFEIHFLKDLIPGYFWIFPLPNGESNVGLDMPSQNIIERKLNLRQEMKAIIEKHPVIKERFKNAIPLTKIEGGGLPLGSKKVSLSGEGYMFCGDAAYLIEPLTGEGIGQAIISGRYAGWQAAKCFEEQNFSAKFLKQYDKTVYDKLWGDHKKRFMLRNQIEKHPIWFNKTLNFMANNSFLKMALKKMLF